MPEGLLAFLMDGDAVAIQCGLALMIAGLASMQWLRRGASAWAHRMVRLSRAAFIAGVAVALLASAAALWFQAAAMGEGALTSAGAMLPMMAGSTHYGHAWSIGMVGLLVSGSAMLARRRFAGLLAGAGLALFMLTRSVVSHAAGNGDFTWKVALAWVHLALACLWVGIVLLGAFAAFRQAPKTPAEAADAAAWVSSLSTAATFALAGILSTGALKVGWATSSLGQLLNSPYGHTLLVKGLLVGVATALGGINRFFVMPPLLTGLQGPRHPMPGLHRRFVWILRVEALVLLLAVAAAAVLSGTAAPGEG